MGTWPFLGGYISLLLLLVACVSGKESKVMSLPVPMLIECITWEIFLCGPDSRGSNHLLFQGLSYLIIYFLVGSVIKLLMSVVPGLSLEQCAWHLVIP